jgi:hypothetical protein
MADRERIKRRIAGWLFVAIVAWMIYLGVRLHAFS